MQPVPGEAGNDPDDIVERIPDGKQGTRAAVVGFDTRVTEWPEDQVVVWRFTLDVSDDAIEPMRRLLAPEEIGRAERLRTEVLRSRFIAGRATLRRILGRALGVDPKRVEFAYGLRGKPALEGISTLEFNLAHTGGSAVCALSARGPLGVDIEAIRPMENAERIIGRYFTPREQAEFLAHSPGSRLGAFYRGWTRKEAFLKATGEGLAASLDSFEVSLAQDREDGGPLLLRVGDDPTAAGRWTLRDVNVGVDHAAALVIAGRLGSLVVTDWLHDETWSA
ncbi:MAG: 4'-phosphopantetheinyl transferase superfamily protein [Isosphaeraceae bacterium]